MSTTETATLDLKLTDGVSGAAASAGNALEDLKRKIIGDKEALSHLQAAMKNLRGGTSTDIAAFKQLKTAVQEHRNSIAQSQAAIIGQGGALAGFSSSASQALGATKAVASGAETTGGSFEKLLGAAKKVPGPLGGMAGGLEDVGKLMSAGGLIGVGAVAAVAAFAAVAVAAIAGAIALAKFTIESSNARRSAVLGIQGYAGNAKAAEELMGSIERVSGSYATGRDQVSAFAQQLHKAGLRGTELESALEGAAIAQTAQGDDAANRFLRQAKAAHRAGASVAALTDAQRAQNGELANAKTEDLGTQMSKLGEAFSDIFSGVDLNGPLSILRAITKSLSQSSIVGKSLRTLMSSLFTPLMGDVSNIGPAIEKLFLRTMIAVMKLRLGFQLMRNALMEWFADGGWSLVGENLVNGLINGISNGAERLMESVRYLGDEAAAALKDALGIHSPSRVFAGFGLQIPAGLAQGIETGAPAAQDAVDAMAPSPSAMASGSASAMGGARTTISIGDIIVNGASNARETAGEIFDELVRRFEEAGVQMGAA